MAVNLSKKFIGAVKDDWLMFSDRPRDYTIGLPIGFGASSIVYAAVYNPPSPETHHSLPCALKVLDLDSLPPRSLTLLQRETQLMSLSKHPNVLRVRGSWVDGHKIYIALRLMNKGSVADVMQYGWPGGMEEEVIKCILRQALRGLNYLHINGFIHRDIKAANLLIDDDGTVLVGDLGVAAPLADDVEPFTKKSTSSDISKMSFDPMSPSKISNVTTPLSRPQMGKRKSFVGTPCWMAPEIIQGKRYDAKADIWSFGITAIELTQGRPPRSRESAHTVLLQTVQENPPTLDLEGGVHRYSRAFKVIVDACLVKDPSKRPTAAELLQTPFFKSGKKKSYLVRTILDRLPPLTMRQERRRRPANSMNQRTMESWDFSSTTVPSIIGSSSKFTPNTKFLSGDQDRDYSRSPSLNASSKSKSMQPLFSQSLLPPLAEHGTKAEQFGMQLSTTPTPIPVPGSVFMHRVSSLSPSASAAVPNSVLPPTPPGFWNRLIRRPSRNVLADDDSLGDNKDRNISRFLAKHGSSSLVRPPVLDPS
ncbi:hypothetical protein PAXRUDRAFT_834320 [Paxillus rubicundulus Ve08.2h10]|uniref:Unplaced genomic scaffold scaffold_1582, whole genome shotgun sequence n=1 Tax=Paxillus rubicundulus Ve08.2h10 TaxID=930991 RepID=A0A0D0DL52_9AGAM|nr:hypothetical protein PAXRUDRAFT_834320 [Paxillus rubicundulus Ve08.2h10]